MREREYLSSNKPGVSVSVRTRASVGERVKAWIPAIAAFSIISGMSAAYVITSESDRKAPPIQNVKNSINAQRAELSELEQRPELQPLMISIGAFQQIMTSCGVAPVSVAATSARTGYAPPTPSWHMRLTSPGLGHLVGCLQIAREAGIDFLVESASINQRGNNTATVVVVGAIN